MSTTSRPGSKRVVTSASLDPELHARLSEMSEKTRLSMSWMTSQAIRQYLDAANAQAGAE